MRIVVSDATTRYVFQPDVHFRSMDPTGVISKIINDVEGAVDAKLMDDNIARAILDEEATVRSTVGVDVVNRAFQEVFKRKVKICVFCDRKISTHDDSTLTLEDPDGNVLGRILSKRMIQEYKDRTDVIWVSDDFVMFPNIVPTGKEQFILHPMTFPVIDENDGCKDVVLCSPAPSSDIILKKYFGVSLMADLATMVVGYDVI